MKPAGRLKADKRSHAMNEREVESSDSIRSARPLRYLQTAVFNGPFPLELGGQLDSITVAYETYGTLNARKDNAVMICHALSGDSHVARHNDEDDSGWWELLIGPGKPVDTNRYFVICSNLIGGCRGSTGPGSTNPKTGRPYGGDFPTVTVRDMVEAERLLVDSLGIYQLMAIVGGSLGGMQAMVWATRYPDRVRGVVPLATAARLNNQAIAFDVVGRNAIRRDPGFFDGQYYERKDAPETGLAIARMIGHITYLSKEAMTRKFDVNRLQPMATSTEFEKVFSVGSYLGHQGDKFVERFDANSYIAITMAIDLFDLGATPSELAEAMRPARCRWLVLSFSTDWLFSPSQSRDIVNALIANNLPVSYSEIQSTCGHDAFLLPDNFDIYGEMIFAFLNNLYNGPAPLPNADVDSGATLNPASIFRNQRLDYDRIAELIPSKTSVLDLGCGTGGLLARLKRERNRHLLGVELDERAILGAIRRDLDVVQVNLDKGLTCFSDRQFDYVVLSQTLQAVNDVEGLINEMLRVGRTCIVSFPNFAYHKLRRMFAEEGRSPKAGGVLRHEWYNTPNRRFFSMADFDDFCKARNIVVSRRVGLDTEQGVEVLDDANLNADLAIYVIGHGGGYGEDDAGLVRDGGGI
jgi:homoserine O-acetyltransferase